MNELILEIVLESISGPTISSYGKQLIPVEFEMVKEPPVPIAFEVGPIIPPETTKPSNQIRRVGHVEINKLVELSQFTMIPIKHKYLTIPGVLHRSLRKTFKAKMVYRNSNLCAKCYTVFTDQKSLYRHNLKYHDRL